MKFTVVFEKKILDFKMFLIRNAFFTKGKNLCQKVTQVMKYVVIKLSN